MQHCWYDDNALLDLRYLIAAEPYDSDEDESHSIGCMLDVGDSAQRMLFEYATRQQRDTAFARLIAQHQAWMAHAHTCEEDEEEYDPS